VGIVTDAQLTLMKAWFDRLLVVDVIKAALPNRDRLLAVNKARREQYLSSG
jgi:glutathione S-transferase